MLPAEEEIIAVRALVARFPNARITIDPNAGWLLNDAVDQCRDFTGVLAYVEDPVGAEGDPATTPQPCST